MYTVIKRMEISASHRLKLSSYGRKYSPVDL